MLLLPLLLLLLLWDPQLKHLLVGMLVAFPDVKSANSTITPAPAVNFHAPTVVKRGILSNFTRHQPNQPINLLEQVLVKPAIIVEKLGT